MLHDTSITDDEQRFVKVETGFQLPLAIGPLIDLGKQKGYTRHFTFIVDISHNVFIFALKYANSTSLEQSMKYTVIDLRYRHREERIITISFLSYRSKLKVKIV